MVTISTSIREREAAKLKELYALKTDLSHAAFAKQHGFSRDAMVWQYLNNHRPLNVQAAAQFALGLGVTIESFSPRLAIEAKYISNAINAGAPTNSDWPFPDLNQDRFDALTVNQRIEIQGLVRERLERFEDMRETKRLNPTSDGRKRA